MELWFILLVSLCLSVLIKSLLSLVWHNRLPPGPLFIPIISTLYWIRKSSVEIEPVLRNLHAKHGPIVSFRIFSRPSIFITDRTLAHQVLVQNGAVFSDRPKARPTSRLISSNQRNISSAAYGPLWRLLRRNLTSEILHSSRVKSFSGTRKWVLDVLLNRLKADSDSGNPVRVVDHFQYAMFCLLLFMCFGDKLDDKKIKDVERVQRRLDVEFSKLNILNFWPRVTKVLFRKRWEKLLQIRKDQEDVLIPLIRARKQAKGEKLSKAKQENDPVEFIVSYVDTLLDLELPETEEKLKLDEDEIITLCSEFLTAGTDTTATALQWIMANLVKYPHIQERILREIKGVMGDREEKEVKEQDLHVLPYLKAVILEGLRRHPPAHFVLPHAVTEDVILNDYLVPKDVMINFMVAEMGWDPKVWEDPMAFKPERFLKNGDEPLDFDITGSKEIKMMPFGAGRRICPGYDLAMLHLEYFIANLVWNFEWKKPANESDIDLSEKQEFTIVMKYPLQVHISPRI
ncbi:hypothetical protein L6164_023651 [Bauhinia variegata]|uniref:Uncharacterized protein n=1 Tax=Bauhinia variegata TaxID=167791 RepID=A0ACB9MIV8_BAUVA|nr:hypothetical protein L6164_023651 [Bauhinia variegata]